MVRSCYVLFYGLSSALSAFFSLRSLNLFLPPQKKTNCKTTGCVRILLWNKENCVNYISTSELKKLMNKRKVARFFPLAFFMWDDDHPIERTILGTSHSYWKSPSRVCDDSERVAMEIRELHTLTVQYRLYGTVHRQNPISPPIIRSTSYSTVQLSGKTRFTSFKNWKLGDARTCSDGRGSHRQKPTLSQWRKDTSAKIRQHVTYWWIFFYRGSHIGKFSKTHTALARGDGTSLQEYPPRA